MIRASLTAVVALCAATAYVGWFYRPPLIVHWGTIATSSNMLITQMVKVYQIFAAPASAMTAIKEPISRSVHWSKCVLE